MPPRNRAVSSRDGRKLSCKRCQFRKLKCSRTEPCARCIASDAPCEYPVVDHKRVPASSEYVLSLERRVTWFEAFIARLREASPDQREIMLYSVPPPLNQDRDHDQNQADANGQPPAPAATARDAEALELVGEDVSANLKLDLDGALIFHGATSIYRTEPHLHQLPEPEPEPEPSNFDHVMEHFGISPQGDVVVRALMDFFRWQYPHFMFIYREAFLRDHFGDRQACKYWSAGLLMSVCALGTLMSDDPCQHQLSDHFFLAAESILMVSGLTRPSIPTVQAFLCLALYEVGRGNLSKGWGFSGIAFRMAQDLGFQRDPENWVSRDASLATTEDVEVRRRIYWGCFVSDKLISLILGRPVHLAYDAAEVDPLKTLPDGPAMEYWRPAGFSEDGVEAAGSSSNIPYIHEQIRLSRIVERMMATMFSPRAKHDGISRRSSLDSLNLELSRWKEFLPDFARWTRWDLASTPPSPGVITLHLFYHGARIALNLDYAGSGSVQAHTATADASRQYCAASAQDVLALVRVYRLRHGLQHAPLVLVYASVQAIRAARTLGTPDEASYLVQALEECSGGWDLARQSLLRLSLDDGGQT